MTVYLIATNSFFSAYSQSDFFGKLIFLSLFLLSVISWVVLVHKTWITFRIKKVSKAFQIELEKKREHFLSLDINDLPRPHRKDIPHPFGHVFLALKLKTLEVLNKNLFFSSQTKENKEKPQVYLSRADLELVESYAVTAISLQEKQLEKNLFILSTITTLAPFLGLLGTVWGILITFSELQKGASASSNSVILGGLSTALVTTVLGLVIAIPALVFYNYLKNTTRTLTSEMEDFLYDLLSTVEMQYRKVE